jgi:hypothetical protein
MRLCDHGLLQGGAWLGTTASAYRRGKPKRLSASTWQRVCWIFAMRTVIDLPLSKTREASSWSTADTEIGGRWVGCYW